MTAVFYNSARSIADVTGDNGHIIGALDGDVDGLFVVGTVFVGHTSDE